MKHMFAFFALAATSLFIQNAHAQRESGGRLAARGIEVQFNSLGNGIDEKALKAILGVVTRGLALTDVTVVTATPFGREGEKSYCIEFFSHEAKDQYGEIIAKLVRKGNSAANHEVTTMRSVTNCGKDSGIEPRF